MRLGIDIDPFMSPYRTGHYYHLYYLLPELARLHEGSIWLFANESVQKLDERQRREIAAAFPGLALKSWRTPRWRTPGRPSWLPIRLSALGRVDVFCHHETGAFPPLEHAANVYLLADLIPLFIDYPGNDLRQGKEELGATAARHGSAIITHSEHSKTDIVRTFGVPESRVHVIPHGAGPQFRPIRQREMAASALGDLGLRPPPFILYVSTLEPRKNHLLLLRAFACLKREEPLLPHKLVLVGPRWLEYEPIFESIAKLGLEEHVIHMDSFERLELLYNAADLFVFPSLYEGFGLPPLEAMACGVPVIASNCSSLPEVVGEAGILLDPRDEREWCDGMRRVLEDGALRRELIQRGLAQAAKFSWRRSAEQMLQVCRTAYQQVHNS